MSRDRFDHLVRLVRAFVAYGFGAEEIYGALSPEYPDEAIVRACDAA